MPLFINRGRFAAADFEATGSHLRQAYGGISEVVQPNKLRISGDHETTGMGMDDCQQNADRTPRNRSRQGAGEAVSQF